MVDSAVELPTLLDTETGDLVLRICGTNRHGQIVRLRSAKCTIGSASRCTLRLRARGVGSVHCLILRGAGGSVVRRFSPDTRLNGRAFSNALLTSGDRLSVGPVEFEVLSPGDNLQHRQQDQSWHETEQLEARQATLEAEQIEPAAASEQIAQPQPEPEPEPREVSPDASVDLDAVLRRIGDAGLLRDEGLQEQPPEESEQELPQDPAAEQPSAPPAPVADEEESVDDYMTRLMERLRTGTSELKQGSYQSQVSQPRPANEPASQAAAKAGAQADEPPASTPAAPQQQKPAQISPRAVAPEKHAGLSAMRELANMSAHIAISHYARRQTKISKQTKLLIAIVGLVGGVILTAMWWRMGTGNLTFYAAMVSFVVALFWGIQYVTLTFDMIRRKSDELGREREKHHGEEHHGDTEDTENTKR